jgi:acetolactate synthase-1/2/3 large subunit
VGEQAAADEKSQQDKMREEIDVDSEPAEPAAFVRRRRTSFMRPGDIVVGDGGDFVATAAYVAARTRRRHVDGSGAARDARRRAGLRDGCEARDTPIARVVIMLGDGSFGLNGMEFEALARQGIKVVGIIGNDACWTQIYAWAAADIRRRRAASRRR